MKEPFPNHMSPELLDKIRSKYFPKREKPEARPVRVIKKSSAHDEKKGSPDAEEKK
jgi:hypothetical protein